LQVHGQALPVGHKGPDGFGGHGAIAQHIAQQDAGSAPFQPAIVRHLALQNGFVGNIARKAFQYFDHILRKRVLS
jgi:hypothetical protein